MDDIVIARAVGTDAQGIHYSNKRTWLDTYPSKEFGITKEDIERRFQENATWEALSRLAKRLANPPSGEISLVAKRNNAVVGYCRLARHYKFNEILAINISPPYQGKGLGKKFWEHGLAHFDPLNPTKVRTASYNARAIGFYRSLGFEECSGLILDYRFRMFNGAILPQLEMCRPPEAYFSARRP